MAIIKGTLGKDAYLRQVGNVLIPKSRSVRETDFRRRFRETLRQIGATWTRDLTEGNRGDWRDINPLPVTNRKGDAATGKQGWQRFACLNFCHAYYQQTIPTHAPGALQTYHVPIVTMQAFVATQELQVRITFPTGTTQDETSQVEWYQFFADPDHTSFGYRRTRLMAIAINIPSGPVQIIMRAPVRFTIKTGKTVYALARLRDGRGHPLNRLVSVTPS